MKTKARIILIMGVSGSGKSTIGKLLSERLNIPFYDGDDFHPQENIDKMHKGQPLNDQDRAGWLTAIHDFSFAQLQLQQSCIIACSALKESYREHLRKEISNHFHLVYLKGDYQTIASRLSNRKGHFMPPSLLKSQFDTLEPPTDAIEVDLQYTPDEIVTQLAARLRGS